jgi:hypothetical protein
VIAKLFPEDDHESDTEEDAGSDVQPAQEATDARGQEGFGEIVLLHIALMNEHRADAHPRRKQEDGETAYLFSVKRRHLDHEEPTPMPVPSAK